MLTAIYGLFDPRELEKIMYIGKGLKRRAESHLKRFKRDGTVVNGLLRRWFKRLEAEGVDPGWRFIDVVVPADDWEFFERLYIAGNKLRNPESCNVHAGGKAFPDEASSAGGRLGGQATQERWRGSQQQKNWMKRGGLATSREELIRRAKLGGAARAKQLSSLEYREHQRKAGRASGLDVSNEELVRRARLGGAARGKQLSSPEGRRHQQMAALSRGILLREKCLPS